MGQLIRRGVFVLGLVLAGALSGFAQNTPLPTPQTSSLSSSSCPGTGCTTMTVSAFGTIGIQVTGTWTGTLTFQGAIDGTNYSSLTCTPTSSSTTTSTTTGNGVWTCSIAGLTSARTTFTSYSSGTAVVTMQAAPSGGNGAGGGGGGGGSDVTIHDPSVTTQKVAVNASGQMSITCANCSGSGASAVDNSAFTAGTTSGAPAMGFFHASIDTVTDGRTAVLAMDNKRNLFNVIRDAAGNARGVNVTAGNALTVDGSGVTQPANVAQINGVTPLMGAGATGTGSLRITAASDSPDVTSLALIDDLPLAQGATTSGKSGVLSQGSVTTSAPTYTTGQISPLSLDTTGALRVTGAVGTTQYAEDSVHVSGDQTVFISCIRRDTTPTSSSNAAGDYSACNVDANGRIFTNTSLYDPSGNAMTLLTDATHDSAANPSGPQMMGEFDDTAPDAVDEGDAGRLRISANRNLYVTVRDAGGSERGLNVNASNQLLASAVITDLIPGFAATNLGKREDDVAGSGDTGVEMLAMREDTPSSTAANGDYIVPKTDSVGRLYVNCASGCSGSGGTSVADRTGTFTPGTTSFTPIGGYLDDVSPDTLAEGNPGVVRMSGNRNLYTAIRDAGGNERGANVNASNQLSVSVDNIGLVDDAAFTIATSRVMPVGGTYKSARDSVDDNDLGTFAMSQVRGLYVSLETPAGDSVLDEATNAVWVQPVGGSMLVGSNGGNFNVLGAVAHDAVGTGVNPLLMGGYASAAAPTDVSADGDAVRAWLLRSGAQAIQPTFAGVLATTGNGASGTGVQRVTIANDSTGILALTTGSAQIGHLEANQSVNVAQINGVTPLMGNGVTGTGSARVTLASDTTSNTNPFYASAVGTSSTAAASGCYLVSAASTNSTSCKGSAGNLFGIRAVNTTTTTYYLRLYNSASAPTCSSATGFIESIPIPPAAAAGGAGGLVQISDIPINYGTGIGFCFTGGSSSTDNTNAATGVFAALVYK